MWQLEIRDIRRTAPLSPAIVTFSLDRPVAGERHGNATLEIAGWVLGNRTGARNVVVSCDGRTLASIPVELYREDVVRTLDARRRPWAERAGFSSLLTLDPPSGAVELELAVEIGRALVPVATITGRVASPSSFAPTRFDPILLSSHGRSGTTLLMKFLSAHPEIVATRSHPYEFRVAQRMLSSVRASRLIEYGYLLERTNDFLVSDFPRNCAEFFLGQIDEFYARMAIANGQPGARFFIEKFNEAGDQSWFYELYPGRAREIVLVRDFRDVFASILAFNERRRIWDFVPRRETPRKVALAWKRPLQLVDLWRRRGDGALLVRYEDLVREPRTTLARIFEWLGADASLATVDAVIAADGDRSPRALTHATTESPEASIGRWKRDLPPAVQRALHESIGEALVAFGYEVPEAVAQRFRAHRRP